MLPYHAYYDTLAKIGDTTDPDWQSTVAGLVVLRLVNDWLDFADVRQRTTNTSFATARELIKHLPATKAIRPHLQRVMRAMEIAEESQFNTVKRPVMHYTQTLILEGRFALAHDALLPFLNQAQSTHNTRAITKITSQLAIISRLAGLGNQAQEYYQNALHHARAIRDYHTEWRTQLGLTKLAFERGEISSVDATLMDLTKKIEAKNDTKFKYLILHDRAFFAHNRGNFTEAISLLEKALKMGKALKYTEYEIMEADLASALDVIGRIPESRHKNLALAESAQNQTVRWGALHNLMYTSYIEGDQASFELYRKGLEFAPLHPWGAIAYRHYAAKGLQRFGRQHEAAQELAKESAIAKQTGITGWHLD